MRYPPAPCRHLDDLPTPIRDLTIAIRDVQQGASWPAPTVDTAVDTWPVPDLLMLIDAIEDHVLLGVSSRLVGELRRIWDRRDRAALFAPTSPVFRLGRIQWIWGRLTLLRDQVAARLDDDE